ncbi:MAG: hypothetical protein HUJ25_02695 [Crocinitomicaceae bacterium]|nr:hypothetical protein [Crocinitomicaceae bacterium]
MIVSEGYTYEYLIHGVMTAIGGIICSFLIHPIFLLAIPIGIMMSASKTGIEIDSSAKRVRKYVSWIIFKTGNWHDLSKIVKIELKYNSQHTKHVRPIYLAKSDTTAKTFDLTLIDDVGTESILNEFTKPGLAFKTLENLKGVSNFEIDNQVEGMLKKQRSARR